jgi:phage tail sheath protein FI
MAANFLHGVETIEVNRGPVPIRVVKAATISLVGIAPKGPSQTLTIVRSASDAAQFGDELPGFDIPKALNAIISQGGATVVVVNVFNPTTMLQTITNEVCLVTSGSTQTDYPPSGPTAPVVKNNAGNVTYVLGTHYTINSFGVITVLPGSGISNGNNLKVTYTTIDTGEISASDIIGSIDTETDTKTGLQLLDDQYNTFGFSPKMIICPGFSSLNSVAAAMRVKSNKFKGFDIVDAPVGTTKADAIAGRGVNGSINFNTSSKRSVLCYPYLKAYDAYSDADELRPYSSFFAGSWCATITNNDIHYSPSNKELFGVTGTERLITWAIDDPLCDANALNEVGIVTVASGFGTGLRTWGNRSAAFPSVTTPDNFLSVQMVRSVVDESVRYASLQFLDLPVNQTWIDLVRESVNKFFRTLEGRGSVLPGAECTFDPTKNPVEEIAAGHVTFTNSFMGPVPGERITFESFIDISALRTLA